MGCFSCFKPSTRHDSSEDTFEADMNKAKELSWKEEENRIRLEKMEEDEQIEIDRAKKESLKIAEEENKKRRLQESIEKGKLEDERQINNSKGKNDVNTPPRICNGCKSEIVDGISANPQCLCCLHCHKPITMHEISKKGNFHKHCYKEHHHPLCYVCKNKIPPTEEGIKYNEHPFWKEKYCPSHENDGTAKCCSCERLEPLGMNYVMLSDDRRLCLDCLESSVMDTYECHSLHLEIREFFEGLFFKVDKEFPLLLVEKQALNEAEEKEKIDYHRAEVTRGLCMSEEQIVTSIKKGPRVGQNKQLIDMVTETQRVGGCEVTGILIIYGLPRLLTGYILSHEMMHAWLRLNGYRNLKLELEEGLCQVLGLRWLESQTFVSTDAAAASASASSYIAPPAAKKDEDWSDFEKKLLEFCINEIKEDDSPIYGLGFKQVYQMLLSNHYNLKETLKDIVTASKNTTPHSKF